MLSARHVVRVVHEQDILSSPLLAEAHSDDVICVLFSWRKKKCSCTNHNSLTHLRQANAEQCRTETKPASPYHTGL